jgi:hypothetical protein
MLYVQAAILTERSAHLHNNSILRKCIGPDTLLWWIRRRRAVRHGPCSDRLQPRLQHEIQVFGTEFRVVTK